MQFLPREILLYTQNKFTWYTKFIYFTQSKSTLQGNLGSFCGYYFFQKKADIGQRDLQSFHL